MNYKYEIVKNKILDLLYPQKCNICGKLGSIICDNCYKELLEYKIDYLDHNKYSLFRYDGLVRNLILDYKFRDFSYLHDLFSICLFNSQKAYNFLNLYDIIMPAPIHKKRKQERGFNQTELIAKDLVLLKYLKDNRLSLLLDSKTLVKVLNTKPQNELSGAERLINLKGAFEVKSEKNIDNKKVLLIDDVYTTGSTFNECRKTLINAGAKEVGIITIAKSMI